MAIANVMTILDSKHRWQMDGEWTLGSQWNFVLLLVGTVVRIRKVLLRRHLNADNYHLSNLRAANKNYQR